MKKDIILTLCLVVLLGGVPYTTARAQRARNAGHGTLPLRRRVLPEKEIQNRCRILHYGCRTRKCRGAIPAGRMLLLQERRTRRNYKKAAYWCEKAARQDIAGAQYILGACYYDGKGVEKNAAQAAAWFESRPGKALLAPKRSWEAATPTAQASPPTIAPALYWFARAAEQGLAEAQFLLGACYYDGKGTAKDLNKAFFWYRKAAYQNLAEAQYFLGMCYYSGEGVEQDNNQSAHWLNKALENGLDGERATLARDMVRRIATAFVYPPIKNLIDSHRDFCDNHLSFKFKVLFFHMP